MRALPGLLWCLLALRVPAAELHSARIEHEDNRYDLEVVAVVEAPVSRVRALLTDFNHLDRLHPTVVRSKHLGREPDGGDRVHVQMRPCVLIFCYNITHVSVFNVRAGGNIEARMIPAESDFAFGQVGWALEETAPGKTRLVYTASLEPDFWIPPIVGPAILQKKLEQIAVGLIVSLDRLGGGRQP